MIQSKKVSGEMADKENGKRHLKQRPVAWNGAQADPLTPHNSHTHSSHNSQTPRTSRVRCVPDFDKLHKSFHIEMEKRKTNNRGVTEFKTFDLTPSGKKTVRLREEKSSAREMRGRNQIRGGGRDVVVKKEGKGGKEECEWGGEGGMRDQPECPHVEEETEIQFEARPDCLQAILHHQPIQLQLGARVPTDIGQPRGVGVGLSPGRHIRLSVYSKRDRALRRLLQSGSSGMADSHSVSHGNKFSQLLQRMVQSTTTTIRTMSRLPRERGGEGGGGGGERGGLGGVQLKLESQLEEAEDDVCEGRGHGDLGRVIPVAPFSQPMTSQLPPHTGTAPYHTPAHLSTHTTLPPSHPLTIHPLDHATRTPCKPSFYQEEPELCGLVWRTAVGQRGVRPACPLACLLEQYYMTPVGNASREDTSYS